MHFVSFKLIVTLLSAGAFLAVPIAIGQTLNYPVTRKSDQVDVYHGVSVADPYRWLEDDNSAETAAWVKAENAVTFSYLEKIPFRQQVRQRLEALFNYTRTTSPIHRGDYYIFSKNDGLQNQNVLYVQKGLDGAPELLLDPNKFSEDGTSRLAYSEASWDGRYLAYGISQGGSDWEEGHVLEIATRKVLPDTLKWIKVSQIAWAKDGFFYSRYPEPAAGHALSSKNVDHRVYFHKIGTPQSDDELVFQDPANPERFHFAVTTEDCRFVFLIVLDSGKGLKGNSLYFRDLSSSNKTFIPIVSEITNDSFSPTRRSRRQIPHQYQSERTQRQSPALRSRLQILVHRSS